MRFTWKIPVVLVLLISVLLSPFCIYPVNGSFTVDSRDKTYFGVTFTGNYSDAKLLIDRVKDYTNLFVICDWNIALNETLLNQVCQYAYDNDMYFMVYFNFVFFNSSQLNESRLELFTEAGLTPFHVPWLSSANDRWGDKFLGAYVLDEPGGKQIDVGHYGGFNTTYAGRRPTTFVNVTTYSEASNNFTRGLGGYYIQRLNNASYSGSIPNATGRTIPVFTAENALYWFDYLAGYDVVFAELGWNHNEAQHIGLCRGAANVQGKEWGAIVTWATNDPPHLATGAQMLQELNIAYDAGAKYLIVFNFPRVNAYGSLTDEHFKAIETFWNRMQNNPRYGVKSAEVAVVLPKDYGWGMRQANDNIWGLWPADDLAPLIGKQIASLIDEYGFNVDIIYDDPQFNYTEKYSTLYYWNGTIIQTAQPFLGLSAPSMFYVLLVIACIVCTSVPSYVVIKNRKKQPRPKAIQAASSSNAASASLGSGKLEFVEGKIRFQAQKGRLRKHRAVREIPLNEIDALTLAGNELTLIWKGAKETLLVSDLALAEAITAQVNTHLQEQNKF